MGQDNPPDKPGFKVVTLTGNDDTDTQTLNLLAAQGYTSITAIQSLNRVIVGNYKG